MTLHSALHQLKSTTIINLDIIIASSIILLLLLLLLYLPIIITTTTTTTIIIIITTIIIIIIIIITAFVVYLQLIDPIVTFVRSGLVSFDRFKIGAARANCMLPIIHWCCLCKLHVAHDSWADYGLRTCSGQHCTGAGVLAACCSLALQLSVLVPDDNGSSAHKQRAWDGAGRAVAAILKRGDACGEAALLVCFRWCSAVHVGMVPC